MLRSHKELTGYKLDARDDEIGKVRDFLFDEARWTIRWMVADTGSWLSRQKVLISPITLGRPDWSRRRFPVDMTKAQIEGAPELDADAPVSREYEKKWFDTYNWPYYWSGANVWGWYELPTGVNARERPASEPIESELPEGNLRSTEEVTGYHIEAEDGEIGHVEEFIVDDETWSLRYLVVDTRNWLPGRKVLVDPGWVSSIAWTERKVVLGLTRDQVEHSPEYDPSEPINREYETRLYDYYGRPVYWS